MKVLNVGISGLLIAFFITNICFAKEVNFVFQKDVGEGQYEFYQVKLDTKGKTGELCFLHSEKSNIPDATMEKIRAGKEWTSFITLQKVPHACFKFELYGSSGWFYSPTVIYGDERYKFFFIGEINMSVMKGVLYQFITSESSEIFPEYKIVDEIKVNAKKFRRKSAQ
jgi:hypothetical protein